MKTTFPCMSCDVYSAIIEQMRQPIQPRMAHMIYHRIYINPVVTVDD